MSGAAKNSSSTSDSEPVGLSASILAESRPSTNFGFAAKVRAQGDGTFRKPSLIGGCVSNVGFPVLSRPSPESTDGRAQVGASITANFVFGSNCDLQRPLKYRRFSTRNETFGAECRQSAGKRTFRRSEAKVRLVPKRDIHAHGDYCSCRGVIGGCMTHVTQPFKDRKVPADLARASHR